MKKLLLLAVAMVLGIASMNADVVKDTAKYSAVNGYELRSLWIQSEIQKNNTQLLKDLNAGRGMAVKNGQLLFCKRGGLSKTGDIMVYDGATGTLVKDLPLDSTNVFTWTKNDTVRYVGIPCNDVHVDKAGHVLVGNLETNLNNEPFQVWNIDMNTGKGTKVLESITSGLTASAIRIDAFGVYGDVTGDGYILAAVAGDELGVGDQVLRWDIKGGVVTSVLPTFIAIQKYWPTTVKTNGTAPRVTPIDNDLFYLDGFNSAAALYDMNGTLVDGFGNAANCAPFNVGNNGIDEFALNGKNFVIYINSNTVAVPPQTWRLCEYGANQAFTGMQQYFQFPAGGMGKTSNPARVAVPCIELNAAKTVANIYVYAAASGVAAYQFALTKDFPTAVNTVKANVLKMCTVSDGIEFSESANVVVYNFAGQKVAAKLNVNRVELTPGMYIVKAITASGASTTEKVIVK